jgi:hypothetical protein
MPHTCTEALSYQYHDILSLLMSQEGGRLIEIMGAAAAIYAVASRSMRRAIIAISSMMAIALLLSALGHGAGTQAAHQLSPCYSLRAIVNAAPKLIAAWLIEGQTAPR